ncbi:hypothetical protein [Brevundimonas olei]
MTVGNSWSLVQADVADVAKVLQSQQKDDAARASGEVWVSITSGKYSTS